MLFPTAIFALFFVVVFTLHWITVPYVRLRKAIILSGSLFFYGYWSWKFALMLLTSAILNHFFAVRIYRSADARVRRRWVVWGVGLNLLVLGIFKYTSFLFAKFLVPLAIPLCEHFGTTEQLISLQLTVLPFIAKIVLPVGISFYTFQALSYVVDVYRGKIEPARHVIDFANYLAFFPQLVAGPIVRASDLLPQMEDLPRYDVKINTGMAGTFILMGLFKKIVIANWLSENLAEPVFSMPEYYGSVDTILGVYAYAVQIYCDFSAYSDIAVGCAMLFGFTFPFNFNAPYFASTLQDFWRRWHISLSTWLRDYLYIPLGGSRCGQVRVTVNLMVTFVLGGLWHGAAWQFVLWGFYHGAYLSVERVFLKRIKGSTRLSRTLGQIWIFQVVCVSWVLFRATDMTSALEIFRGVFRAGSPELFSAQAIIVLLVGFGMQFLDADRSIRLQNKVNLMPPWLQGLTAAAILVMILGMGPRGVAPFIYFQF